MTSSDISMGLVGTKSKQQSVRRQFANYEGESELDARSQGTAKSKRWAAQSFHHPSSVNMYKRFAKELKRTKEESSSESESIEAPKDELSASSVSDLESGSSVAENENIGDQPNYMQEDDDVLETGVLTIDELEAGDEAVPRKPKRGEVLLYQCSICPEKELFSLRDVKEHIASKVRLIITTGTAKRVSGIRLRFGSWFSCLFLFFWAAILTRF